MGSIYEALAKHLDHAPDVASATRRKYRHDLARWLRLGGSIHATDITAASVSDVRAAGLRRGLSPATIEDTLTTIRTILAGSGSVPPEIGRRLKRRRSDARQPSLTEIGTLYDAATKALWPRQPSLMGWARPGRDGHSGYFYWRVIRPLAAQSQRETFWRGLTVLALWSGLRLADLLRLSWDEHVGGDRLVVVASKTGKRHSLPVTPIVRRNLDALRGLGTPLVLGIRDSARNRTMIRHELARLCDSAGIPVIVPKQLRRSSVTAWDIAGPGCGVIVHGCGTPRVMQHYRDDFRVLEAAADQFPWPENMLASNEREARQRLTHELLILVSRLPPERVRDVVKVAKAFGR
jgi:integrase